MKKIIIGFMVLMICFFCFCKKSEEIPNIPIPTKQPPTINSFTADKTTLEVNESTTLRWNVSNALKVQLNLNILTDLGEVPAIGSLKVNPTESECRSNTYYLDAFNSDGSVQKKVEIVVNYPIPPDVEYKVSGSTNSVFITYSNKDEGTSQVYSGIPWSYKFNNAKSGQFLYVSAQNQRAKGTVKVEIFKNGNLFKTSTSTGAYVIATASGSY